MSKSKPAIHPVAVVHVRLRSLISDALERGLSFGLTRAYKYVDGPLLREDWDEARMEYVLHELWLALDDVCEITDGEIPS